MATQYPSPGIVPPEITGAEYWQPTTHRIAYVPQPGIDAYRTICIERLGETYGRKGGARIPTCDEIDAPVGIVTTGTATLLPPPWTVPPATPPAPPWSGWTPPGRGGPPDGPDTPVLPPFVPLIPPREPRNPETPTVYEPDMPPAPPIVPLPASSLTLILAIAVLTVIARRVN